MFQMVYSEEQLPEHKAPKSQLETSATTMELAQASTPGKAIKTHKSMPKTETFQLKTTSIKWTNSK